jgi:diguanylate cyclase (GGDEF)-like protein
MPRSGETRSPVAADALTVRQRTVDRSRGGTVALGFSGAALLLAVTWAGAHGWETGVGPLQTGALLLAVALAEQVAITVGRRTTYTFSAPLLVLAALLGGPLTGLFAGALSGAADIRTVWRRRLTYAGLASLQGFAAGVVGLLPYDTPGEAAAVTTLAVLVFFAIGTAGRALVFVDRGVQDIRRHLGEGVVAEVAEGLIAVPMLALLVRAYPQGHGLVLASIGSLLAGLGLLQAMRRRHERELSAALGSALTDSLTGAPNRLAFEEALAAEHSRVLRGALPAGVFLVDVDRFKAVNDRYGHQVGDRVLIEIVERLRRALRRGDVVCRWGGEELAVLAPGLADREAVTAFAERLREVVAAEPLSVSLRLLPVTVSVGGTTLDGSLDPQAAVARADGALYRAKRRRNAAVVELRPEPARLVLAHS